jgi:hypothetical protein
MKKYDVLIDRVLSVPFIVEAENEEEAKEKAMEQSYAYDWKDAAIISHEVVDTEEVDGVFHKDWRE